MSEDTNSRTLAEAVVGGKAARACDRCVKRRARWYCAADDAFLCQSCDVTIHSANPLARRHDRVRLDSSSFSGSGTWHHGFTRKPRTPRKSGRSATVHDIVPEIGIDNDQIENNFEEERLFYQVPEFDSAASEKFVTTSEDSNGNDNVESCLDGFFQTDKELAEFAADVETLFGKGPENESFPANSFELKVEVEENGEEEVRIGNNECFDHEIAGGESLDRSFDYDSRASFAEEDDEKKVGVVKEQNGKDRGDKDKFSKRSNNKKDLMLSLDYESVIATWNGQSPPWIADGRPELDPDDQFWPAFPSVKGEEEARQRYGVGLRMRAGFTDEGREARVMRYREKRRTRLFSKKIRYEVRKLNAEKRPRMKGRFVKRSAFAQLSK